MTDGMRRGSRHRSGPPQYRHRNAGRTVEDWANFAARGQEIGGMIMTGSGIIGGLIFGAMALPASVVLGAVVIAAFGCLAAAGVRKYKGAQHAYDKYMHDHRHEARLEKAINNFSRSISPVFESKAQLTVAPSESEVPASPIMKTIQLSKPAADQPPGNAVH